MRNKTFISSMVLSVACVSAANAGVVDPFTTAQTAVGVSSAQFINISGGLFNQRTLERSGGGSGSIVAASGSVNFVPDSSTGVPAFTLRYRQDASESPIDLSGISMSFTLAGTGSYKLQWVFEDATGKGADMVVNSVQPGTITFAATNTQAGFNWASVVVMNVGFLQGSSSTGVLSNFNYTAVPAPGALALLGAAGLVGARRRRA